MPSILFSHTNFPAQFGAFGTWLAEQGWDVWFATARADASAPPGCRMFYFEAREAPADSVHADMHVLDRALRTASGFALSAEISQANGFMPDIVVAHSGWGAGTYARAVWPEARFIAYAEWWYAHPSPDIAPEEPDLESDVHLRAHALGKNAPVLLDLAKPTPFCVQPGFRPRSFHRGYGNE